MARLIIKTEGFGNRVIELAMGANRVGRDEEYEICLDHDTISTLHCKLTLSADGVYVHDCNSTNGTFVNGEPVLEAWLDPGQILRIGSVELLVESTGVTLAIPKIKPAPPLPAAPLDDGGIICARHPQVGAAFKCTQCQAFLCSACVRVLKLKGRRPLFLCPVCNNKCDRLAEEQLKPKYGSGRFFETVKSKFGYGKPKE
jgi:hypothetical protein